VGRDSPALPPLCLLQGPHAASAPLQFCPGFPQTLFSLLSPPFSSSPALKRGQLQAQALRVERVAWGTFASLATHRPAALCTPELVSGTADPCPKHPPGLVSTTAQRTLLQKCTRSTGVPKGSPSGGRAEMGTHPSGGPAPHHFQKAHPWGRTGSQPPLASQPCRARARGAAGLRISF